MSRPQPVLGYPSKTEAVAALRRQGLGWAEVAEQTGIPVKNARALIASADRTRAMRDRPALTGADLAEIWDLLADGLATLGDGYFVFGADGQPVPESIDDDAALGLVFRQAAALRKIENALGRRPGAWRDHPKWISDLIDGRLAP